MRIAICGGSPLNVKQIKESVYMFSNYKKINIVVDVFTNALELLKSKQNFILIFISFENKNNLKFAHHLYKNKSPIPIIVFSNNICHAADAFKINAYNFLEMPMQEGVIFKILTNFFTSFLSVTIILTDGLENACINTNDILYLEAQNKRCVVHLKGQTLNCNKTMARVFSALPEGRFLKISRSFIVNSDHIARFSNKQIILTNSEALYPSRHFYKTFKSDYTALKMPKIP